MDRIIIAMMIFGCLVFSIEAGAQEKEKWNLDYEKHLSQSSPGEVPSFSYLIFLMMGIGGAIVFLVFCLKRFFVAGRSAGGKKLMLQESLYLGNKTFLHMVRCQDKLMVIGVSPHNINTISEVPITITTMDEEKQETTKFSQILNNFLSSPQSKGNPFRQKKTNGNSEGQKLQNFSSSDQSVLSRE